MTIHEMKVDSSPAPEIPEPDVYEHPLPEDRLDADAVKVLRRLTRNDHVAFLVGGGVRDLLLGRRPKDYDVATSARPQEVRALFRNCRVIGRRFRLAHILFSGGKVIETATFRRDPSEDDAADPLIRRDNVFGEPHEDAVRRDFTINGLFYDLNRGEVIDYVGGVSDLEHGILRMIGDPNRRLQEDPVRILRAIKFSARLDFGIDPSLYDAIVRHRADLRRAAPPRVLEEILRFLRSRVAHRSFYLMWDTGVLAQVLPEVAAFVEDESPAADLLWGRLMAADRMAAAGENFSDAVLLAALLYDPILEWIEDSPDPSKRFEAFFEDVTERLSVPRRMKDQVRSIVVAQRRLDSGKLGSLPRRDFFGEAAQLFALRATAEGRALPKWYTEQEPRPKGNKPRRRRSPRR
ncbi:MAG: polynucleotide adenylyltransferase PcnB [Myxococcales bacterium]|nr:polynucleotide adenylyltransferase PcnB [Myxococcales bacterium]